MGGGRDLRIPGESVNNSLPSSSTIEHRSKSKNNPLQHPDFIKKVNEGLKEWRVPGLSIAVVDGEHTRQDQLRTLSIGSDVIKEKPHARELLLRLTVSISVIRLAAAPRKDHYHIGTAVFRRRDYVVFEPFPEYAQEFEAFFLVI